ncbi:hypothetical protein [Streptomyces sp. NBC_01187]|uniref:hypothetical protein n=1 Tax=Streptomyces sp. NBC_01187 TaxID=2903766 RepID=UPI00386B166D|nr:hypothetical protein OG220_31240 [Streptomyces sp. NBC_01187]
MARATPAPAAPFGPLEFQLVLLRRMADFQRDRVEEALRALGVGLAAMREANKRWQAMVRSPRGASRGSLARYRSVLGPPEATERRQVGDLTCEALSWALPLWPDLRFEVMSAPGGGAVWNEWLVRAPGAPPPRLRTVEDLVPWSCTVDEVARAFPPAWPREGSTPLSQQLACTAPDTQGELHDVVAEFTWGLLQRLPEDSVRGPDSRP